MSSVRSAVLFLAAVASILARAQTAVQPPASDEEVHRAYLTGEQALKQGDLPAAEAAFRKVLEKVPSDVGALVNIGVVHMRQKKWEQALAELQRAARLAPALAGVRLNLGLIQYRRGEYKKAIPYFESVVRDAPESKQARYLLGICYFVADRYGLAASDLEPLWEASQNDLMYLYVLSIAAGKSGRPKLEQRALARLLVVGANTPELHLFLGKAYLAREEKEHAAAELERAAEGNPKLPFLHYTLGVLYRRQRDFDRAKREFLEDLAIEPDIADTYEQLGVVCSALEQPSEAAGYFEKAVKLNPRLPFSWFQLGKIRQKEGQYDAALRALGSALVLDPDNASAHYLRAQVLRAVGLNAEAKIELATVRKLHAQTTDRLEQEISGKYRDPQVVLENAR